MRGLTYGYYGTEPPEPRWGLRGRAVSRRAQDDAPDPLTVCYACTERAVTTDGHAMEGLGLRGQAVCMACGTENACQECGERLDGTGQCPTPTEHD